MLPMDALLGAGFFLSFGAAAAGAVPVSACFRASSVHHGLSRLILYNTFSRASPVALASFFFSFRILSLR